MIRPVLAGRGIIGGALAVGAGGAAPWYLAGGAPTPVAAYQPKGSVSLAASYVNLANPGTNDAAPGVAPTWDAVNGWVFNGTTQYLTTGVAPSGSGWSMLVRYANATAAERILAGCIQSSARFFVAHEAAASAGNVRYASGGFGDVAPNGGADGVLGVAGQQGYRNGAADGASFGIGTIPATRPIFVGAVNNGGSAAFLFIGNIQAAAIYSSTLDAAMVAAVSAAMAAL